ncbi:polysaccharide biosynthesis PFTS motif protein [Sediminibacterium sp.]|uniref:polysaccharide biosynthesis PFTS motif protein n=1 Tax=Sediminibacterium sp. TaxID=1917865 RepID=UPI0025D6E97A|nr:polysaccharide biosynthesis PFTS motif protein [Sediminibacterium sp.]MBT9485452.1 polysaccharide biosynthesis PFTS motif protein [Sediminibacterium sp.]
MTNLINQFKQLHFFKARKKAYIRRYMRGFQVLKNSNELDIISVIKEDLSRTSLGLTNKNSSSLIFFSAVNNIDLIIRQFLIVKLLTVDFNKSILLGVLKDKRTINYPLPREWRAVLEHHGFIANTWSNRLKWSIFILTYFFSGIASILVFTWKSAKMMFQKNVVIPPYAYFQTLAGNNFPVQHVDVGQSHDIFSWYRQWNGKPPDVNRFAHSVKDIPNDRLIDDTQYMSFMFPYLRKASQVLPYFIWGILASIRAFFDCLLGRFWHALLLREASKSNIIRLLEHDKLAQDYLLHNSNHIFKPLWTYEAEKRGSRVLFYFYSTNCETFKTSTGYPLQEHTWHVMSWSNYLVWDQYQADFIKRCVGDVGHKIHIVGSIWFSTSTKSIPSINSDKSIAVFDVQPMRDSYYCILGQSNGYNTPRIVNQFLTDIADTLLERNYTILFKRKRNIGNLVHKKYFNLTEKLSNKKDFITVDPGLDAIRLIEKSAAVISMPFTSTAILGKELGKPSIYYDPFGQIQKDDRAAHGIKVIVGKEELKEWLDDLFATTLEYNTEIKSKN